MGKSAPAPPDYTAAAEQTAEGNLEMLKFQTEANRPTQVTPWGTVDWTKETTGGQYNPWTGQTMGGEESWTQNVTLSPDQQAALDSQMALQLQRSQMGEEMFGRAAEELGEAPDFSGFADFQTGPEANRYTGGPQYQGSEFDPRQQYQTSEFDPRSQYDAQAIQRGVDDPTDIRNRAEEALYGRATSRLDPQFEQAQAGMETQLYNQGLRPGDEAYDTAMANFGRQKTDAYEQARMGAITGGGEEAQRQFGMQVGAGQFANQAAQQALAQQMGIGGQEFSEELSQKQQQFQEQMAAGGRTSDEEFRQNQQMFAEQMGMGQQQFAQWMTSKGQEFQEGMTSAQMQNQVRNAQMAEEMQKRGWTLNEINALLTGQQVGMPGFQDFKASDRVQGADYLGAADMGYQAELGAHSADQAMMNSLMSGAGQAGGMAMMMSDRRLKENVHKIGSVRGHNIYVWDWIWGGRGAGVMADEVPDAVVQHPAGYAMVDYRRL